MFAVQQAYRPCLAPEFAAILDSVLSVYDAEMLQ